MTEIEHQIKRAKESIDDAAGTESERYAQFKLAAGQIHALCAIAEVLLAINERQELEKERRELLRQREVDLPY